MIEYSRKYKINLIMNGRRYKDASLDLKKVDCFPLCFKDFNLKHYKHNDR